MTRLQLQEIINSAEYYDIEQTKSDIKNNLKNAVIDYIGEYGLTAFRLDLDKILISGEKTWGGVR